MSAWERKQNKGRLYQKSKLKKIEELTNGVRSLANDPDLRTAPLPPPPPLLPLLGLEVAAVAVAAPLTELGIVSLSSAVVPPGYLGTGYDDGGGIPLLPPVGIGGGACGCLGCCCCCCCACT